MKDEDDEYEVEKKLHKHNNSVIIMLLLILITQVCVLDYKITSIDKSIVDITAIEKKIDDIAKIEQTQLDIDTSDFSELKKAIDRLDCYDEFLKVINDEPSKDPLYSTMLKAKLLQLILNESKTVGNIELSICEEQQNKMDKLNDQMTNIINQEFSKNE